MALRRRRRRRDGERGSAIIEAAFVAPVFFLLIFAIFEFGFMLRNYLTLANATTDAARTASVMGDNLDADFQIIRSLEHALQPVGLEALDFVVIYEASGPNDTVPTACLTAPQGPTGAIKCNRYTAADFFLPYVDPVTSLETDNFRCVSATLSIDRYWCPTTRETSISGSPDYVGVYMEINHDYLTGFIGDTRTLANNKIVRIEPERS